MEVLCKTKFIMMLETFLAHHLSNRRMGCLDFQRVAYIWKGGMSWIAFSKRQGKISSTTTFRCMAEITEFHSHYKCIQLFQKFIKFLLALCCYRALVTFGVNALYGRHKNRRGVWQGEWDSSNAHDFIKYTISKGYHIDSWEFGIHFDDYLFFI